LLGTLRATLGRAISNNVPALYGIPAGPKGEICIALVFRLKLELEFKL
jgi:hypothetical protein